MSAREWKPGDVAVLTTPAADWDTCIAVKGGYDYWYCKHGRSTHPAATPISGPLVVIDPEDREQVERLRDLMDLAYAEQSEGALDFLARHTGARGNAMQAALRSLVTPPKPKEPLGLGAVVEDADGNRWVKWTRDLDPDIAPWTAADDGGADVTYADIAAVKTLSEGVQ